MISTASTHGATAPPHQNDAATLPPGNHDFRSPFFRISLTSSPPPSGQLISPSPPRRLHLKAPPFTITLQKNSQSSSSSSSMNSIFVVQLLKALETCKTTLQKEQGMAFAHAVAAGFDIDHMVPLVSFDECFGAMRLMEAPSLPLSSRKHKTGQWLDIEASETQSSHKGMKTISCSWAFSVQTNTKLSWPHQFFQVTACLLGFLLLLPMLRQQMSFHFSIHSTTQVSRSIKDESNLHEPHNGCIAVVVAIQ
ncbi:hypothetical protein ACS0TY_021604 [Phlomoides rotata]